MGNEVKKQKNEDNLTRDQLVAMVHLLQEEVNRLNQLLFGVKSEKRFEEPVNQTLLFNEAEELAESAEEVSEDDEALEVKGHRRIRGKRRPLPLSLPRVRVEHDLNPHEKICVVHGTELVKIGEKSSEQLDYVPARLQVIENVTFTYKCPCCEKSEEPGAFVSTKLPPQILPKSMASPSVLAAICTAKYVNAMPLYRLEADLQRRGIDVPRSTMSRWIVGLGHACHGLFNLLAEVGA